MKDAKADERTAFLVEGPDFGSAEFYGNWLLAAAKAEEFWKVLQTAPDFKREHGPVCFCCMPNFGIEASLMVMNLRDHQNSFLIDLEEVEGWVFTMMFGMGFFEECGEHYRMVIPAGLTKEKFQKAVLALVETDDDVCMLHPEYFVDPMPLARAQAAQRSLSRSLLAS